MLLEKKFLNTPEKLLTILFKSEYLVSIQMRKEQLWLMT